MQEEEKGAKRQQYRPGSRNPFDTPQSVSRILQA
jgi:hypothetical protein